MNNEKINEIKSLDQYFPKGDKRRGEALVLVAEAFLLGKESAQLPKGFKEGKCKCGNFYGYCGVDIGYCVKCIDKMETGPD